MRLGQLETPCALVDLEAAERNAVRFRRRAAALGVVLRPHVKTHKCVAGAELQVAGGQRSIAVSTLAEAGHFAGAGFADIVWAVPMDPSRVHEAAELSARLERFGVLVDHPQVVAELEAAGAGLDVRWHVHLKVDCGGGRAGVDPDGEQAILLARRIADADHLCLAGLLTHAGHAYRCHGRDEVTAVAREERNAVVRLAARLRELGCDPGELSVGSTPTFAAVDSLAGVTEARPGNYLFFDVFQAAIGSCGLADVAFSVLATVIGHYPERGEMLVNAGALALSKDPGPVHVQPECGFGRITDLAGTPLPGLTVVSLTQEHGLVRAAAPADLERLAIGSRVRILPNHSCLAAACFDRYHVHRDGEVVDEWRPVRGW